MNKRVMNIHIYMYTHRHMWLHDWPVFWLVFHTACHCIRPQKDRQTTCMNSNIYKPPSTTFVIWPDIRSCVMYTCMCQMYIYDINRTKLVPFRPLLSIHTENDHCQYLLLPHRHPLSPNIETTETLKQHMCMRTKFKHSNSKLKEQHMCTRPKFGRSHKAGLSNLVSPPPLCVASFRGRIKSHSARKASIQLLLDRGWLWQGSACRERSQRVQEQSHLCVSCIFDHTNCFLEKTDASSSRPNFFWNHVCCVRDVSAVQAGKVGKGGNAVQRRRN